MSEREDRERRGETALKSRPKTRKPNLYKVVLNNDDYTTMEFVIHVLMSFFRKDRAEATHLMLYVHTKGRAVAGVYPRDTAESKVVQVTEYAREQGHPLLLTAEPE